MESATLERPRGLETAGEIRFAFATVVSMTMSNFLDAVIRLIPSRCRHIRSKDAAAELEKNGTGRCKSCSPPILAQPHFKKNDKYVTVKSFEAGEEGECSVIRSKSTGGLFAVKHTRAVVQPKPTHTPQSGLRVPLPSEARMLLRAPNHRNIIRFLHVQPSTSPNRHLIYLEYCSGGDLLEQLRTWRDEKLKTPPIFTLHVLISLSRALAFIHHGLQPVSRQKYTYRANHQALIHGDIKPDNIFLRWPATDCGMPDIVLADFGMAQIASESRGITGTPGYDSPEVRAVAKLRKDDPAAYQATRWRRVMTTKSDVYQMGLILHLLATGRYFKVDSDPALIDLPVSGEGESVVGLLAFMVWCLQVEPVDRAECTTSLETGCLHAVDALEQRRDVVFARHGALDGSLWNVCSLKKA